MTDEPTETRIFLEQKVMVQQCGGWDADGWPTCPACGPPRCPRCGREMTCGSGPYVPYYTQGRLPRHKWETMGEAPTGG